MSTHDPDPTQTQRQASSDDARAAPAQDAGKDDAKQADKPSPLKNPKVKWTLLLIGLVVLIALVAWLVYYLTTGRYLQETNNAYLQADSVAVAPRVNGYVTAVYVGDNQTVKAGQPLLQIDERTYRATQQQAQAVVAVRQADIAAAEAGLQAQRATLLQARTQVTAAAASLRFAQGEAKRFAPLAASGADTHEHYESIVHDRDRAQAQYDAAKAQVVAAESQVQGASAQLDQARAGLQQAQADADQAEVAMEDTRLTARIDGRIGDKTVQVGQFVAAGTRLMSVVPVDALYLSANFKETQVGLMRPGQPARIEVDALSGVELDGVVESIAPGTGSQFALLPPENATGNFTKVVQRVPVRIRLKAGAEARKVLVPGMSVTVTVDTRAAKDVKDRVQQESKQGEGRP
ncbi:HlyD family secretion protein [Xanthomonas bundabergensis]|uniref:HlyD family secretion protein n=1 Tax=Xanthomonas bundabergensis TaxID=3160842 RepID=UPI0035139FE8